MPLRPHEVSSGLRTPRAPYCRTCVSIIVAEELLDGPDVVPALEEVRGTMPERVEVTLSAASAAAAFTARCRTRSWRWWWRSKPLDSV